MSNSTKLHPGMTFLVVDDHPLYVEGLTLTLTRLIPEQNIYSCTHANEAIEFILKHANLDLVLLDLALPDLGGLGLLQEIRKRKIPIPVAILSASEDPADVHAAMVAGASGFISKSYRSDKIIDAIREVLNGEPHTPDFYQATPDPSGYNLSQELNITPRQLEVLKLLAAGLPNKKICATLGLTEHTVKSHLKALFAALEVHNRTECVTVATRLGLLP